MYAGFVTGTRPKHINKQTKQRCYLQIDVGFLSDEETKILPKQTKPSIFCVLVMNALTKSPQIISLGLSESLSPEIARYKFYFSKSILFDIE